VLPKLLVLLREQAPDTSLVDFKYQILIL